MSQLRKINTCNSQCKTRKSDMKKMVVSMNSKCYHNTYYIKYYKLPGQVSCHAATHRMILLRRYASLKIYAQQVSTIYFWNTSTYYHMSSDIHVNMSLSGLNGSLPELIFYMRKKCKITRSELKVLEKGKNFRFPGGSQCTSMHCYCCSGGFS